MIGNNWYILCYNGLGDIMKDKKVIFMGTPSYSVPVLEMLLRNVDVVLVITQPDKEVGRKKVLTPCPIKKLALENNIPVLSPAKLKFEYKEIMNDFLDVDLIVTCAYGQIIPEEFIYYPKYDTVNVHASLLPKYRGGAPIHHAIINGEDETGITIMYTDKGMDSGDIIAKSSIAIGIDDTYDIVSDKMSVLGASFLEKLLPSIFDGTALRSRQNHDDKTFAYVIKREDEHLDFNDTSLNVHNKIRGLSSTPGCYAMLDGDNIKIFLSSLNNVSSTDLDAGTITRVDKDSIYVACLDGEVRILSIQVPGKKRMSVRDYLNGKDYNDLIGKVFK